MLGEIRHIKKTENEHSLSSNGKTSDQRSKNHQLPPFLAFSTKKLQSKSRFSHHSSQKDLDSTCTLKTIDKSE